MINTRILYCLLFALALSAIVLVTLSLVRVSRRHSTVFVPETLKEFGDSNHHGEYSLSTPPNYQVSLSIVQPTVVVTDTLLTVGTEAASDSEISVFTDIPRRDAHVLTGGAKVLSQLFTGCFHDIPDKKDSEDSDMADAIARDLLMHFNNMASSYAETNPTAIITLTDDANQLHSYVGMLTYITGENFSFQILSDTTATNGDDINVNGGSPVYTSLNITFNNFWDSMFIEYKPTSSTHECGVSGSLKLSTGTTLCGHDLLYRLDALATILARG